MFIDFINFIIARHHLIYSALLQHITISSIAIFLSLILGVPLGIFIAYNKRFSKFFLSVAAVFQTIPSLALFGLIIPFLGIGIKPAIFVLFLYSLLPILTNTYIGITSIDPIFIEVGKSMGMTNFQILTLVQLPLSTSFIMGGIRISTVITIGTATIAALIGAGGLGEIIFRGIATSNNFLVLAGAIPTALLAIFANYTLGIFEKSLAPTSKFSTPKEKKKTTLEAKLILALFLMGFGFSSYRYLSYEKTPTIHIGYKNFLEQQVLGNMLAVMIEENTGYKTELTELGSTSIIFKALQNSEIDLYPEYTGTAYLVILGKNETVDAPKALKVVQELFHKDYGIDVLEPLGFENTHALAMSSEIAKQYNIDSISDLIQYSKNLKFAAAHEFMEREDGLPGLKKVYPVNFKEVLSISHGLIANALVAHKVDVGVLYSTDETIPKYDLKLLKDDKKYFPPYEAVIMVRQNLDSKKKEIIEVLNHLSGKIDEKDMQKLNLLASETNTPLKEVTKKFLIEKNILKVKTR